MKILHLEDEKVIAEIMHVAITAYDPSVTIKHFIVADKALPFIEDNLDNIRVYLLDIRVPGKLDGLELARKIRELGCTRPIFMSSAYQKPPTELLKELDLQWMEKPWHLMEAAKLLVPLANQD